MSHYSSKEMLVGSRCSTDDLTSLKRTLLQLASNIKIYANMKELDPELTEPTNNNLVNDL